MARPTGPGWRSWLCVAAASVAASTVPGWGPALRFSRQHILDGEWWRLISGHFMHWDSPHLIVNLLAAAAIWHYAGPAVRSATWLASAVVSALASGLGLLLLTPWIHYGGLSGVLHGLLLTAALARCGGEWLARWVLAAALAKIAWEQWQGPLAASLISVPVAVDAHLYGGIGGGLVGVACWMRAATPPSQPTTPATPATQPHDD